MKKITVLHVHNNSSEHALFRQLCQNCGIETVLTSDNGDSALELLRQLTEIDILVTELEIRPGQTGIGLAEDAKLIHPQLIAVLMTAPIPPYAWSASNGIVDHIWERSPRVAQQFLELVSKVNRQRSKRPKTSRVMA